MTLAEPEQLPPPIRELLKRFVRRRRRIAIARAVGIALALAALWLLAWGVVDRLFPLHWIVRSILLLKLVAIVMLVLARPLRALLRRQVDWPQAAKQIEQRDPRFGEALATVVSQRSNGSSGRASPQLLDRLSEQVVSELGNSRQIARKLARVRPAVTALAAGVAAGFILFDLSLWPWLGLSQLLARQVMPLGSVPPVTTTRLEVLTGAAQVVQGRPLTIIARATPPDSAAPTLRTTIDGQTWSSIPMTAASDGSLFFTLASVTRDMRYQVAAGDALSALHEVRVLRQPVVREVRLRLTYPAYIGREPLELVSGGVIEAPMGTLAQAWLVASEPLSDAWITLNGQRLGTMPASDPHVRQAEFEILSDATCSVELQSDRGVRGSGSGELVIRAIADRPPIARIMLPEVPWIARPRDLLEIPYQWADDYGVATLEALVRINDAQPLRLPIDRPDDARRGDRVLRLDLAELRVAAADSLGVTLVATDGAGQSSSAPPCQVIVGSRALAPADRRLAMALRDAERQAKSVVSQLASVDSGRAQARTAAAGEAAQRVVDALLRAVSDADEARWSALAELVDAAQQQAASIEAQGAADPSGLPRERLDAMRRNAEHVHTRIATLWHAQVSAMIHGMQAVQRELPQARAAPLAAVMQADAAEIGLDPGSADFSKHLAERVQAAEQLVAAARGIDLVQVAREWSEGEDPSRHVFAERLFAAAQVLERRGQAQRARDLRLASRAARNIDARVDRLSAAGHDMRAAYVGALGTLVAPDAGESSSVDRARQAMRGWAGEVDVLAGASDPATGPAEPDARRRVDATTQRTRAAETAGNQQQALGAIRRAQEALARMPELLDKTVQAGDWLRQTQELAQEADRAVQSAASDQQPAARRALAVAQAQVLDASKALEDVAQSLDPDYTWTMGRELEAFAPQTLSAVWPIEQELAPALEALADAVQSRDVDAAEQSTGDARHAIALVQDGLRDARQAMLERDPLVAARWFAQQVNARSTTQPEASLPRSARPGPPRDRMPNWRDAAGAPGDAETDLPGYQDALRAYFQLLGESPAE
jgi:hypothetical protein